MTYEEAMAVNARLADYWLDAKQTYATMGIDMLHARLGEEGECSFSLIYVPQRRFQGYARTLHGGVTALLLDSAGAVCALQVPGKEGTWPMTGTMNLAFHKPIHFGSSHSPLIAKAWLIRTRGKVILTESEIRDSGGCRIAMAHATYIQAPL